MEEKVRHENPKDKEEKEVKITLTVEYDSNYGGNLEEELRKFLILRRDQPQTTPDVIEKEA